MGLLKMHTGYNEYENGFLKATMGGGVQSWIPRVIAKRHRST